MTPSYITHNRGSLIVTTYDSLNASTSHASAPSSTSTAVTSSLILKSLKRQRSPTSWPCNKSQQCWVGHFSKMGNHHLPRIIVHQILCWLSQQRDTKNDSRTAWKNPFVSVISTIADGPPQLRTMMSGVSPATMLFPLMKIPVELPSRTKGTRGGTTTLWHQALIRFSLTATIDHACQSRTDPISHKHSCS